MMENTMTRLIGGVLGLLLAAAPWAQGAEVAGVKVEETARVGEAELVLNGAGVRTRLFFKVYVAALYLPARTADARTAIAGPRPKRVWMHILRDLDSAALASALREGLQNNHSAAELEALEPRIQALTGLLTADKEIKAGTVILLDDLPGQGTRVSADGQVRGIVAGEDLYPALLRVWLGDRPADPALKRAMLGG
jgi:hypothetical protein